MIKTKSIQAHQSNCQSACEYCSRTRSAPFVARRTKRRAPPLNHVMAYRFQPLISRLVEKKGIPRGEAEGLYTDMLRFLFLCGTVSKVLAPSERIDLAWHEFLLFTKEYHRFCQRMFGFFIHHNPRESGKRPPPTNGESVIRNTLTFARATFGDLSANWEFPGVKAFGCNYNCARCSTPSTNCQTAN